MCIIHGRIHEGLWCGWRDMMCTYKDEVNVLAGVAQWIEYQPANQRVTGLIPSQDTYLGYGPGPQ